MGRPRPLPCIDEGEGVPVLVLHAFGMESRVYLPLTRQLADRVRVVIPDLALSSPWERWSFEHVLDCLVFTLDELDIEQVSVIGHSFGGGLELGLAANWPDWITECVFADTLGPRRQLSLAREVTRPIGILRTATRTAAVSFLRSCAAHPLQLASAA